MLIHPTADPVLAEVARRAILADERLGLATMGLLLKILQHAPRWDVNAQTLFELGEKERGELRESRRSIRKMIHDLEETGYMRRTKGRLSSGGFYTTLDVFDVPFQFTDSPYGQEHGVMPVEGAGMVYLIGQSTGPVVKIGTTVNVDTRLRGLQTAHPYRLVARWSCPGDVHLESYLHHRFRDLRLVGEWFDFKDADPIAEVAAGAEFYYELPPGMLSAPIEHVG